MSIRSSSRSLFNDDIEGLFIFLILFIPSGSKPKSHTSRKADIIRNQNAINEQYYSDQSK